MIEGEKTFCFCTLALRKRYRALALLLAKDIEKYSPNTTFVVLTDNLNDFSNKPNIMAFKHEQQGITCYHDKRFVIAKALQMFNTCIFIDADMRILGEVPQDIESLPGITARSGCGIIKHNNTQDRQRIFTAIAKLAKKLNVELQEAKWINEFLFTVSRDSGKEVEFIRQWGKIASYFELNGIYDGEGNAIGLAAAKAGLLIRIDSVDRFTFFKEQIEKERNKNEISWTSEKLAALEIQKKLEYPKRSKMEKLLDKVGNYIMYFCRLLKLRIISLRDLEFYYSRKLDN